MNEGLTCSELVRFKELCTKANNVQLPILKNTVVGQIEDRTTRGVTHA